MNVVVVFVLVLVAIAVIAAVSGPRMYSTRRRTVIIDDEPVERVTRVVEEEPVSTTHVVSERRY